MEDLELIMINWPTVVTILVCAIGIILVIRSLALIHLYYWERRHPRKSHTLLHHINETAVRRAERDGTLSLSEREKQEINQLRAKLRTEYGEYGFGHNAGKKEPGSSTTGFTPSAGG